MQVPWECLEEARVALDQGMLEQAVTYLKCAVEAVGGDAKHLDPDDYEKYVSIRQGITAARLNDVAVPGTSG